MQDSTSPLFANAVIACLSEGRDPTVQEMCHVAKRIWADGAADRSAFAWHAMPTTSTERLLALRAAHLALCGSADTSI